jgi:hypothetical protein
MENCGKRVVESHSRTINAVLAALEKAGVEIEEGGIRIVRKR